MSPPLIQDLSACQDKSLAGGKAVNLGHLIRAGFPVPGGFAITTAAYRAAHAASADGDIPAALAEQIRAAYRALGSPPVAVRSSATAEDMAEASMAGQYDTFLDILGDEALLRAVRACWASLDSPRTRSYLKEHGIDLARVAMAVVVQRLVPAEVAGVLFSANPGTGNRHEMVVEASWGLGEAVVSGRVQPDVLRLDADTGRVLDARIADKQIWIAPGQHDELPVEPERRHAPCLHSRDVAALWKLGRRAAKHFGSPQDLEWAIHDGDLFLLQSRPITTLEDAEACEDLLRDTRARLRALLDEGRGPWVPHNIAETLQHPTPLTWSVVRRFMSGGGGFGAMYRAVGFEPSARVTRDGFLERIAGRVYMDAALAPEMFYEGYPMRYDLELLRRNPDASQTPPTVPCGPFAARTAMARRVGAINGALAQLHATLDERLANEVIPQFVQWVRAEKQRDLGRCSTAELIELWHQRERRVLDDFAPQSLLPSLLAGGAINELKTFLEEHLWDEDPEPLANLLASGGPPDLTAQANAKLYLVARGTLSPEHWLAEFGHRAPDEFDLATPRWREQADHLRALADRLAGGADPAAIHAAHVAKVEQRLAQLPLAGPERERLTALVAAARRYLPYRENGKYYLMLGYDLLRDLAVEMGRRLEVGDDVFLLTLEELTDALKIGYAPHHLLARRKVERRAERRLSLPHLIDASAITALGEPPKLADAGGAHDAFPVSVGQASGPARIVFSPQAAGDLGAGYVLVCPSTDPAWTPLFVNAAALVLERGGTLSHGAVVAREMSIPAVVLADATALFKDGETLTVDGRNGTVIRGAIADGSLSDEADDDARPADDTRIPRALVPPPPGPGERRAAGWRNRALAFWAIFLVLAFCLPERWLYDPVMRFFDFFLWPAVVHLGRPATVVLVAGALAVVTMLGQYFLTDNPRLREAKRRAGLLTDEAGTLPPGSPRHRALKALAGPVQTRIVLASFVPLALLLGPMVLLFFWLPARVDPANWSPPAGAEVEIVATVDAAWRQPLTLTLDGGPLALDATTPAERTVLPLREALVSQKARWQRVSNLAHLPWEAQAAALRARQDLLADLNAYLDRGVPPQDLKWKVRNPAGAGGRFTATIATPGHPPLTVDIVLGDKDAPRPAEVTAGRHSPLHALAVHYPRPEKKRIFMEGLPDPEWSWLPPWLILYLIAYLPAMFALRWLLGIA